MLHHSIAVASTLALAASAVVALGAAAQAPSSPASFYALKTSYLDGKPADLGVFKGNVTLVVNVASKCGWRRKGSPSSDSRATTSATRSPALPRRLPSSASSPTV